MSKKRHVVEVTRWARDWINKLIKSDSKGSPLLHNQKSKVDEAVRALLKSRKIDL